MIYYLPAIGVFILILLLSTIFGAKVPLPDVISIGPDKIGHLMAYLVLTLSVAWGLYKNKKLTSRNTWMIFLAAAAYGITLEWVQFTFFPSRYFEWWDMLANLIGALIAISIIFFSNKISSE